jgi:type I restriction enzyme S subunit
MSLITVGKILVALPPTLAEQEAIAEALSDADTLIESLEQLLVKKRHIKQGAMQELLTGKKRLPGFSGDWVERPIGEISTSSSEKNSTGGALPVLTCSKHFGFVDSLGFFKNQVFSRNLSTYKIIRGGQIGYPANHIEEGSIGLQDLYEVALVSPIYIVFSVTEGIDPFFVHRLLKLDSYRTKFSTATNASVNRRGSLRWPEFSTIEVSLPRALEEQLAVSLVIRDMESDIALTEDRLKKTRQIKQGMMQELLTGRIRLV